MTINQALDKLFSLEDTEQKLQLVEKLRKLKLEVGGRTRVDEETMEKIVELEGK